MKLKVLAAEDSKLFHKFLDAALADELYEKRFVLDGESALEVWREWRPKVMLLDMMMPGKSGYTVLKEVRHEELRLPPSHKTAIIMITGLADKESIIDCLKVGIQGYIVKPFKPEQVAAKVEAALAQLERQH